MTYGRVLMSCMFCAIGSFLFGYDSGIIGSSIAQDTFKSYFGHISDSETGGIVSSYTGGALLGSAVVSFLSDPLGRKKAVFIGSLLAIFGCALQGGAVTVGMLIAGRFIAGIAVGILSSTIPLYCAELAPARYRGGLAGLQQFMLSWGYFAAQWIGYGSSFSKTTFQWRFPLSFQCFPALILACGVMFLPESPRWLVEKDRYDEAQKVLNLLHLNKERSNTEYIRLEFVEIRDAVEMDKREAVRSWRGLLAVPSWRYRLLLGCALQAMTQFSGINVVNYYGPRIYAILGVGTQDALRIIGISGTLSIIYCTIMLLVVDKVGRIPPLIISTGGCAAALLVNAVLGQTLYGPGTNNQNALRAGIAMNFVFSLFFTPLGVISWVYNGEIYPTQIRAKGNSVATFTNWAFNLIFAQTAPLGLARYGFKFFYLFFVLGVIDTIALFFYPETKQKTLEQLDEVFGDQKIPHALEGAGEASAAAVVRNEKLEVLHTEHSA